VYDTGLEKFKAERTTPESLDMQRLLFLMKKNRCHNAVIEASSHALILKRLNQIDFAVAVYTNLTRDHLDFHGTMEDYLAAKALLLKKLVGPSPYAVINLDVPEFVRLCDDPDLLYIYYSIDNTEADVYCRSRSIEPGGTTFELVTPMGERSVHLKLPGRFNLQNAVAAAAAGLASGVDLDNVVNGLESVEPVPGRFNHIDAGQPFAIYVDYAHTPDAIRRLCESARELTSGRLLVLFGCGGDRDRGKRSMMGQTAMTYADFVVVTSDNPRSEDPEAIIEDIKPGLEGDSYEIHVRREDAVRAVLKQAVEGDVVLLAGKGAEPYQESKGERIPYSDIDEALAALKELGYKGAAEGSEE
jgi:UDP-N-acetylmuramoyl-L-alanyl-D-glutamate--2,6-diaminopimelate ligase